MKKKKKEEEKVFDPNSLSFLQPDQTIVHHFEKHQAVTFPFLVLTLAFKIGIWSESVNTGPVEKELSEIHCGKLKHKL